MILLLIPQRGLGGGFAWRTKRELGIGLRGLDVWGFGGI